MHANDWRYQNNFGTSTHFHKEEGSPERWELQEEVTKGNNPQETSAKETRVSATVCSETHRWPNLWVEGPSSSSGKACWCSGDRGRYLWLCRPSPLKWCWATDWARGQGKVERLEQMWREATTETKQEGGGCVFPLQLLNLKQSIADRSPGSNRLWFRSTSTSLFWFSSECKVLFGRQSLCGSDEAAHIDLVLRHDRHAPHWDGA